MEFNFGSVAWPHNLFNEFPNDKYLCSQEILSHFIHLLIAYDSNQFLNLFQNGFLKILIIWANLIDKRKYLDVIFNSLII